MQLACSLLTVGLASLIGLQRSAPPELDARQILEQTAKVYRECKTYRDSGAVKTVFHSDERTWTEIKPFTTAFVRPDRFRYEFLNRRGEEEFHRYLVWKQGKDVRTWWDVQPGIEEATLDGALTAAKGVSGNSSYTIPSLLLGPMQGFGLLTDLPNATRKEDADLNFSRCFLIQGGTVDEPMTLWIDQKTFLLRRIEEQNTFDDFRAEDTTTYEPVLDGEIPESLLLFDPPEPVPVLSSVRRLLHPAPEDLDAPRILERMAQVYATCKTYRDSGVARRLFLEDGRVDRTERVPFTTAFVRPDRFRYEAQVRRGEKEFDRYLLWRLGQEVRTWWDLRPEIEQKPLGVALGGAWAVTLGSAPTIPCLLLPQEMLGLRVTGLEDAERMEDDVLGGLPCFLVQGEWVEASVTLWIDQTTYLVRRIDSVNGFAETTTTYEPVIDEEIPESMLVFDPPAPEER